MQKITPNLWFDSDAEAAARLYASLIPGSRIGPITRYGKAGFEIHGRPEGSVMTVDFELGGVRFIALNGGPHFRFTPAISLFVVLETEAEVDRFWSRLSEGGSVLMPLDAYDWSPKYGWLSDRWGLSWQVALGKRADVGQTVTPSLMFVGPQHGNAEAAIAFYTSLFDNSRVEGILRYDGSGKDPAGTVTHAQFYLDGEALMAMDSALEHGFGFNEAVSLMITCRDQAEIDRFWAALSAVPAAEQCGWLKDRFGVSWQVVPERMAAMMADPDPAKVARVTEAFLAMKKFDVAELERAFAGGPEARIPVAAGGTWP